MKLLGVFSLLFIVFSASSNVFQGSPFSLPPSCVDRWDTPFSTITQKVDHFNASNTDTFQMGYYATGEFYAAGGPLFIYVGGNWEVAPQFGGHLGEMARQMNGYLFATQHRYYGQSYPTP